jgi:hypothetical protein
MNRYISTLICAVVIVCALPSITSAQTLPTTEKKTPRKYDKLLTAVESFAKLNAQIEIRQREYVILAPFVEDVRDYANKLTNVCDSKCTKSVATKTPKLKKFSDSLVEANRRYEAMTPAITEKNALLMSEMKRVEFLPEQLSKQKAMAALNQLNLENLYHYKAYAKTYHSADSAMLSLAVSSDLTSIVTSFASTTDRLVKLRSVQPGMNTMVLNLKNKVPDIRARIKALEDRRKSLVCTATLAEDYAVTVHCTP